jgi:hypothetical protein
MFHLQSMLHDHNKMLFLLGKTKEEAGSAEEQPASNRFYGYTL